MNRIVILLLLLSFTAGCATHRHIVGHGAKEGTSATDMQWYVLYGALPMNQVDTQKMADGAADYEIKTGYSPVSLIINCFASIVTLHCRDVTVKK